LSREELPTWADVSVAVVMSTEPTNIRIAGMGQSTDPYQVGDRDLLAMPALREAVNRALADAGSTVADVDLIELDALTGVDEALSVEALGLAQPGEGFGYVADSPHFNPSGGSAAAFCPPAMGLTRLVEACLQMRGTAGDIQLPDVRRALITGSSVVASQTHTAIVLEAA
jgi:acetyl-CoA C-acetyltransferase